MFTIRRHFYWQYSVRICADLTESSTRRRRPHAIHDAFACGHDSIVAGEAAEAAHLGSKARDCQCEIAVACCFSQSSITIFCQSNSCRWAGALPKFHTKPPVDDLPSTHPSMTTDDANAKSASLAFAKLRPGSRRGSIAQVPSAL